MMVGTPQNRSANWILGEDNLQLNPYTDQERITQRYLLALLYYSTAGEFWKMTAKFLTAENECRWTDGSSSIMVDCIAGTVTTLQLGEPLCNNIPFAFAQNHLCLIITLSSSHADIIFHQQIIL
mgnify:CR=1 FL=1